MCCSVLQCVKATEEDVRVRCKNLGDTEYMAFLTEYRALLVYYRALSIEYRALLIDYTTLFINTGLFW